MSNLTRFSVSLSENLINDFDKQIEKEGYPTRSKAISDLIGTYLLNSTMEKNSTTATGSIILVYDHHKRDLTQKLSEIQHQYHHIVISTQHIHLDHDTCLEVIIVKGNVSEIKVLNNKIKKEKGVTHSSLFMVSK